ncbi:hypothetical protein GCM10009565_85010 [Amycolatopsis albidoflavus]
MCGKNNNAISERFAGPVAARCADPPAGRTPAAVSSGGEPVPASASPGFGAVFRRVGPVVSASANGPAGRERLSRRTWRRAWESDLLPAGERSRYKGPDAEEGCFDSARRPRSRKPGTEIRA